MVGGVYVSSVKPEGALYESLGGVGWGASTLESLNHTTEAHTHTLYCSINENTSPGLRSVCRRS